MKMSYWIVHSSKFNLSGKKVTILMKFILFKNYIMPLKHLQFFASGKSSKMLVKPWLSNRIWDILLLKGLKITAYFFQNIIKISTLLVQHKLLQLENIGSL